MPVEMAVVTVSAMVDALIDIPGSFVELPVTVVMFPRIVNDTEKACCNNRRLPDAGEMVNVRKGRIASTVRLCLAAIVDAISIDIAPMNVSTMVCPVGKFTVKVNFTVPAGEPGATTGAEDDDCRDVDDELTLAALEEDGPDVAEEEYANEPPVDDDREPDDVVPAELSLDCAVEEAELSLTALDDDESTPTALEDDGGDDAEEEYADELPADIG